MLTHILTNADILNTNDYTIKLTNLLQNDYERQIDMSLDYGDYFHKPESGIVLAFIIYYMVVLECVKIYLPDKEFLDFCT